VDGSPAGGKTDFARRTRRSAEFIDQLRTQYAGILTGGQGGAPRAPGEGGGGSGLPPVTVYDPSSRKKQGRLDGVLEGKDEPLPGYPLLCIKRQRSTFLRMVPALQRCMNALNREDAVAGVKVLEDGLAQIEAAYRQYPKLIIGKQTQAAMAALNVGRQVVGATFATVLPAPEAATPRAPTLCITDFKNAVSSAQKQMSPLLLDLDGDGRADVTTPDYTGDRGAFVARGAVSFDLGGAGRRARTEWLQPGQDGLLVMDTNGNGICDDSTELFGDQDGFSDGYAKLALLDADGDGRLTGRELAHLSAWVDDGDGVCRPSELATVTQLGITAISVRHVAWRATFVRHGKACAMWDWFPRSEDL
jgi:hypothetical protein